MCFTVKSYVERENMNFIENSADEKYVANIRYSADEKYVANILMGLKQCDPPNCDSDNDDLGGLVGSMNKLSLDLNDKLVQSDSEEIIKARIDKTDVIIKKQCSLFKNIIVELKWLPRGTAHIIYYIIKICFEIFDYSIRLADLIDRVLIIKIPFVSIGRLLVYGYWYSLIYITIRKFPLFGNLLHAIFKKLILIINTANTPEIPVTPAYIINELEKDEALQGMISKFQDSASEAVKDVGDMVYTYMIDMAGKIPILLAIHQLLKLQKGEVETINNHLYKITYGQQQTNYRLDNAIENDDENTNMIIKQFDELNINVHGLKKITEDTNLYLQGLDNNLEKTETVLGIKLDQLKGSNANILTRLNIQNTQTTTKLITDLVFAGAPQLMGLAEAMGVLPTGLLVNNNPAFPGGKKRSTRKKCKRSKVYKRGSSKKRGICKNTKKRVKSKKSSKRGAKKTKRK